MATTPPRRRRFLPAGSQFLHVVDLDGSFAGRAENREAVEAILQSFEGHVQLGGGIRTRDRSKAGSIWACRAW
jgi:phosphoribosylformimino-5-aminoimidazole carboxamide ribonucleotide (ProFAR) isomerase